MHDSSEGLRSIIGRKLIEQVDPFEEAALVEHCKNLDQLGREIGSNLNLWNRIKLEFCNSYSRSLLVWYNLHPTIVCKQCSWLALLQTRDLSETSCWLSVNTNYAHTMKGSFARQSCNIMVNVVSYSLFITTAKFFLLTFIIVHPFNC